jgi:hypothetical protein
MCAGGIGIPVLRLSKQLLILADLGMFSVNFVLLRGVPAELSAVEASDVV